MNYIILLQSYAAEGDFNYVSNPVNVTLSTDESAPVKITIINDNVFELTETFLANLSFPDREALPPGVTLNQTSARVIILDNDGESLNPHAFLNNCSISTVSLHYTGMHGIDIEELKKPYGISAFVGL